MNPNSYELAMRDQALAALMGALPDGGNNFGADPLDSGNIDVGAHHYHHHGYQGGFGYEFGAQPLMLNPNAMHLLSPGVPAAVPSAGSPAAVNPAIIQAWHNQQLQDAHTSNREILLNPNRHSRTKVERYSFSLTQPLVLNTALAGFNTTLQPNTMIRPQRVVMNAPSPNFVLLTGLFVANVNVLVGGTEDAFTYSAVAQGVILDLPTLEPANRATASGSYTGLVPPGFAIGFAFTFIVTFQGPSSIAGGASV